MKDDQQSKDHHLQLAKGTKTLRSEESPKGTNVENISWNDWGHLSRFGKSLLHKFPNCW